MFGKMFKAQCALSLAVLASLTSFSFADNINVNGANRNMLVYAPKNIEKGRPLIIQMHGMNQDAAYQKNAAKWEPVADTGRFVVVFPNGENRAWDIGGDKDINFLKAIINEMSNKYGIDKKRVYVSGFSMGGMMSYHVANKMGDMIAAIAPVSGGGNPSSPKRPMPIIHTHGTTDDVVNYNGGVGNVKNWVKQEKCSSNSKVIKPYPASKPGSAAYLEIWSGCEGGSEIRLLSITGKGHWYSMDEAVSVNTSVEIWNFVKQFSLDGSSITPPIQVPTNRDSIFNGGFDSTDVAWDLQTHGDAKATGGSEKGKYNLDITAIGSENYQVQVIQHDLHLEKDQWYEISFDASANETRKLEVNVEQHTDPWASYLKEKSNFDIGTESKNFKFSFQMTAATDNDARLSFNAGSATGTLYLDNVKLKKIAEPADVDKTGIVATPLRFNSRETSFSVYNLVGKRIGFVEIIENDEPSMSKTLRNAGFGKGVYILRSKNRAFMVPVDR